MPSDPHKKVDNAQRPNPLSAFVRALARAAARRDWSDQVKSIQTSSEHDEKEKDTPPGSD
jgi:hypothetical protein